MADEQKKVVSSGLPMKKAKEEAERLNRLLCLLKDMRELFEQNTEFLSRLREDDGDMFSYARIGVWVWDFSRRAYTPRVWDNLITGVDDNKLESLDARVKELIRRINDANKPTDRGEDGGGVPECGVDTACAGGNIGADNEDSEQGSEEGSGSVLSTA